MRLVRKQGYAISDQEYEPGLRSIAVPVPNATGRADVAMTLSVHASQVSVAEVMERLLPARARGGDTFGNPLESRRIAHSRQRMVMRSTTWKN